MTLTFGIYKDHDLSDPIIPDSYIQWLASRGKYYKPGNRFEPSWKVPFDTWIAARLEMKRRGYRSIGSRFEKEKL